MIGNGAVIILVSVKSRDGRRIGCRQRTHNPSTKVHCGFKSHPSHQLADDVTPVMRGE